MTDTPLPQRPLAATPATAPLPFLPSPGQRRVLSTAELRARGVSAAEAGARCRDGGPWQRFLPGVYLLHSATPTSEERLHAAVLYASGAGAARAMVTGAAALALYGFAAAAPLTALERIDVLVERTRRLRSSGWVRIVRAAEPPAPREVTGVPVAPAARALADALAQITDPHTVRLLVTEAVRDGHCEPGALVRELNRARLLTRPQVVDAVDTVLAEGRALAESRLYEMVRAESLPEPLWNVDLRLPGGPHLGGVDAYWPEFAVAVELDTRSPRRDEDGAGGGAGPGAEWTEHSRKRETLERLGITVVHLTPRKLRDALEQQAIVVRTALMAAGDRAPAAYVVVLPR
ncbi:hypothetical protein [Streptomyces lichenis]|uniref:Transcriptional regulator, AbiEi antitoxin, Type IV TA system n=1 Tax=Streptomyces lichenis TaxID=2306967 RepID=A0ABT0I673_9ACTN|nr:hypothetical protein [Streptomyces lichenis]MCK8676813.1 hypothetical protein [Streptomyces lichenis]